MLCVGFHEPCLGSQVGVGFRRTLLSHPGFISTLLPPTPAWPVQPHKALFMPGGWPGAPEGGRGRRGGSCTHGQGTSGTHLGRPATATLCSGVGHEVGVVSSPSPPFLPAPSPGPSFPTQLPLTPATSKEAEGESGAERDHGWLAGAGGTWELGLGASVSPGDGTKAPIG